MKIYLTLMAVLL